MRELIVAVGLILLICATAVMADSGSESPFTLGTGARELSLGGAGVAVSDGATAPYWNPSNLASAQHFNFTGFYSRLFDTDVAYHYAGLVWPTLEMGTFGLGVFRLGVDGIEERDERNLMLGYFSEQRLAAYASYGRSLGSYRVGFSIHFEHQSLADRTATSTPGLTLALGRSIAPASGWFRSADLTLVLRNVITPNMTLLNEKVSLPFRAELGSRMLLTPAGENHKAAVNVSVGKREGEDPYTALGLEYSLQEMLMLRGGWDGGDLSYGAGIHFGPLSFDYALVNRDLGTMHMFSLTTSVGSSVEQRREAREQRREREFDRMMTERVSSQNERMISDLLESGQSLLSAGELAKASSDLERALFLCRASGGDTTKIAEVAAEARLRLEQIADQERFNELLDSATSRFAQGDLLGTKYYAEVALSLNATSAIAADLLTQAERAMQDASAQDRLITDRLYTLDSLVDQGKLSEAEDLHRNIAQYTSDYPRIEAMGRRIRFERLRRTAEAAAGDGDPVRAASLADSIAILFPGHEWLPAFRQRLQRTKSELATTAPAKTVTAPPKLSAAVRKEADEAYQEGQKAFAEGDLGNAIMHWEQVNRLAPNFRSVTDYLVKAYKLTGIDLYGKNRLSEAIGYWQKALDLAPTSGEIASYIARTRGEMARLEEAGEND
ncbi:MAG: tetratricopeptide repeat protein [bacterium]|nr:tetratricopeptide repeat protein [bacterium]